MCAMKTEGDYKKMRLQVRVELAVYVYLAGALTSVGPRPSHLSPCLRAGTASSTNCCSFSSSLSSGFDAGLRRGHGEGARCVVEAGPRRRRIGVRHEDTVLSSLGRKRGGEGWILKPTSCRDGLDLGRVRGCTSQMR
jgi:hypothetical protein